MFQNNVGNGKQAFPLAVHPYSKNKIKNSLVYDYTALATPFQKVTSFKNGSKVLLSPFADNKDFYPNVFTAIKLAKSEKKATAEVLYHLLDGKNPELRFNKVIGDRVEATGVNSVKNTFNGKKSKYGKNGQLKELDKSFVVFDFQDKNVSKEEREKIARMINAKMKQFKANKFNFFLINDEVLKVTEKMNINEIRKVLKVQKTN